MRIAPLICGCWDGSNVWLQWDKHPQAERYEVQLSYRQRVGDPWGEFDTVIPKQGEESNWGVVPTWKEDWLLKARVRVILSDGTTTEWEMAQEALFLQGICKMEILASVVGVSFEKEAAFHAIVDGAPACYVLPEAVTLSPGGIWQGDMVSIGASGWHQIDHPGQFSVSPSIGVFVRNIEASRKEMEITGRDWTRIKPAENQPLRIAFNGGGGN